MNNKLIDKDTVVKLLTEEKWYPSHSARTTEVELRTSELLNAILTDIIIKILKL